MGRIFKDWRNESLCAWLWESSSGKRDHGGDKRENCKSGALKKIEEWVQTEWRVWLS